MKKIKYYFLKAIFWLLSIIPFWFYHGLSSFIGFLFIKLKLYRYKAVMENLKKAFPDKSEKEIKKIANKFYYHFVDLLIESIKAFSVSAKQIKKRWKVNMTPEVQKLLDEKRNLALIMPHYGNWEWGVPSLCMMTDQNQPIGLGIYKPLKNKLMDKLMKENRSRFPGANLIPKNEVSKHVAKYRDQHFMLGFAADQAPLNGYNAYWMEFLGQESGVFFGPEKFCKKLGLVPIYVHVQKRGRSKYEVDLEIITEQPKDTDYGYITERHMKLLEADIHKNPYLWLWSHKRWKRSKPADYEEKRASLEK
jgi:KDO2-lipid IV(A) lauroyltransferase